jgi:uncharacterized protein YjbJ (UPF0337 family)
MNMNWDRIEGNWKQFKGNAVQQWGKLTGDQLDVIAGKRDLLLGRIQELYGISKEEGEKQLADWEKRMQQVAHSNETTVIPPKARGPNALCRRHHPHPPVAARADVLRHHGRLHPRAARDRGDHDPGQGDQRAKADLTPGRPPTAAAEC